MSQNKVQKRIMGRLEGREIILWCIGILVCVGSGWLWFDNMEQRWIPSFNEKSEYRKQPMLAAKRLTQKKGYQVIEQDHLSTEQKGIAGNGSMIIANNDGVMAQEQAQTLLAWVAKGNTLISFPQVRYVEPPPQAQQEQVKKPGAKTEEEALAEQIDAALEPASRRADPSMRDPIGAYLGISTKYRLPRAAQKNSQAKPASAENNAGVTNSIEVENEDEVYDDEDEPSAPTAPNQQSEHSTTAPLQETIEQVRPEHLTQHQSFVQLPHTQRGLIVSRSAYIMFSDRSKFKPLYQVDGGDSLRIYQHGRGKIVVLPQNIFIGQSLRENDNGQLLLDLLSLNSQGKQFIIVKSLKAIHWTDLAWARFSYGIIGFVLLIALWAWRASRRFGSLLAMPEPERRSLLEHIDASARWSWRTAQGRQNLLDASRRLCFDRIKRRAPELMRLPQNKMLEELAQQAGLDANNLAHACFDAASSNPLQFTRQIQLLQRLRTHYER